MAVLEADGGPDTEQQTSYYFLVQGDVVDMTQTYPGIDQTIEQVGPFSVISGLTVTSADTYEISEPAYVHAAYLGDGDAVYRYDGQQFTTESQVRNLSGASSTTIQDELIRYVDAVSPPDDGNGDDTPPAEEPENGGGSKNLLLALGGLWAASKIL